MVGQGRAQFLHLDLPPFFHLSVYIKDVSLGFFPVKQRIAKVRPSGTLPITALITEDVS